MAILVPINLPNSCSCCYFSHKSDTFPICNISQEDLAWNKGIKRKDFDWTTQRSKLCPLKEINTIIKEI